MNSIRVFNTHSKHRVRRKETIELARYVLRGEGCSNAELNVVYIGDERMTGMNATYRKHRYSTDVLSFSLAEGPARQLEGEVYVNVDSARRQAREYRVSIAEETRRLVTHGLLHLLGYDDATPPQREKMSKTEDFYLRQFSKNHS
ncbi:MAG: rRNA maturation RNase YbeY [Bacteroidota bacterium]|jgi:rRNA maturation RNase YbeY